MLSLDQFQRIALKDRAFPPMVPAREPPHFYDMFGRNKPKKDHGLYYLLPGMNSGNRRKRKQWNRRAWVFAIIFSTIFGLVLWVMNK
jgi:hypothetical protein